MESSRIFVRDMDVEMLIGVYDHEKQARQRVIVNVEAWLPPATRWRGDALDQTTVNYEKIVSAIRHIAARGHLNLVETFAEELAAFCLQDRLVEQVRVRIEKPDAFADAAAVGAEIIRRRS